MNDKPVRKIKNNGTKKNTGYFPSKKNERSIAYESLLEKNYFYFLEFDKDVVSFLEQPLTLEYNILNKKRRYTPDLRVIRKEKIQIIEIKPKTKLLKLLCDEKEKAKFDAAKYYCNERNYEFKFVTDDDIYSGNILNNIKYLFRYSRVKVPAIYELKLRNELAKGQMSIAELLQSLEYMGVQNEHKMYIYSLIYEGVIKINLMESINSNTIVTL